MASSPKFKTVFGCQACGFESSKWLGRCPDCGEWNSFVEERQEVPDGGVQGPRALAFTETGAKPKPYDLVDASDTPRIPSGIGEFDRVLGGGIVPGSHGPHRRRAGHRQEHAPAPGRAPARPAGRRRALRLRRGVGAADQDAAASGWASRGAGLFLMAETSLERILERGRPAQARGARRRLRADHLLVAFPVRARQHQPGARGRDPAPHAGQGPRGHHLPRSGT